MGDAEEVRPVPEGAPTLDESRIGVAVKDGAVTRTGHVPSYYEAIEAERVVLRVEGVREVANDLEVGLPIYGPVTDTDLAAAILHSVAWHVAVPDDAVQASVHGGWVTLRGRVGHAHERDAAAEAVRPLKDVRGVTNLIDVAPADPPTRRPPAS